MATAARRWSRKWVTAGGHVRPGIVTARLRRGPPRLFPGTPPPASTTVQVGALFLPGAVLEVEVTAAVPEPPHQRP